MKRTFVLSIAVFVSITNLVSAEVIRDGIDIDFVTIGNVGNIADTEIMVSDGTTGYGSVDYEYQIGKYEITNSQWNTFVSIAGAPTGNPSDAYDKSAYYAGAQQPTNGVSWYEVAQFCNYLTSGDKSLGAYLFGGNNINPGDFLGVDRDSAVSTYGIAYVIPTENEWYKAAYYKPDDSGYSLYANGTDVAPIAGVNTNYNYVIGQPWDVGTGAMEQNGTFNMMGNVIEWTETLSEGGGRHVRGGAYPVDSSHLRPSYNNGDNMFSEADATGFRIAAIPEPASLLLLGLGGVLSRKR